MSSKDIIRGIILIGVISAIVVVFVLLGNKKEIGSCTEYQCDVKNLHLATTIDIYKEEEQIAKVKGDILRFVTDPLTMYGMDEKRIAYASDSYHLIAQDSHSILVNDEVTAEMVGKIDLLGETYEIYNTDGEKIADVTFNALNTNGEMYDMNGKLIADFNSKPFFNDFEIRILEECEMDENTVIKIFCSYYSDQAADSSSGGSSSSKKSGS